MDDDRYVERGIAVFSNWGLFGVVAVGFLMEGIARQLYPLSLVGIAAVVAGAVGHLIINSYFGQSFSRGEASLGLAAMAAIVLIFVVAWLTIRLAETTVWTGLTLIVVVIATGGVYIATKFGLKGAFSQFHARDARGGRR